MSTSALVADGLQKYSEQLWESTSGGGVRVQQHSDETPHRRYWRQPTSRRYAASDDFQSEFVSGKSGIL